MVSQFLIYSLAAQIANADVNPIRAMDFEKSTATFLGGQLQHTKNCQINLFESGLPPAGTRLRIQASGKRGGSVYDRNELFETTLYLSNDKDHFIVLRCKSSTQDELLLERFLQQVKGQFQFDIKMATDVEEDGTNVVSRQIEPSQKVYFLKTVGDHEWGYNSLANAVAFQDGRVNNTPDTYRAYCTFSRHKHACGNKPCNIEFPKAITEAYPLLYSMTEYSYGNSQKPTMRMQTWLYFRAEKLELVGDFRCMSAADKPLNELTIEELRQILGDYVRFVD